MINTRITPLLFLSLGLSLIALPTVEAASPPPRTGIWAMQRLPEDAAGVPKMAAAAKANPNLSGICLYIGWNGMEKQAGQYDCTQVDRAVKGLQGIGMKYQLCLHPGASTPDFVYAKGAKAFQTKIMNPHRAT